jgi:hypothetical protein
MPDLHEAIAERVAEWRAAGYPHGEFPAIAEILQFALDDAPGSLRYLRVANFRALETYWYLRLVEGTPRVPELYARLFDRPSERLAALGLTNDEFRTILMDGLANPFQPDGWSAIEEISYPADRAALVWPVERTIAENRADYGYHYNPYNFDSTPESEFYEHVLRLLNLQPTDVQASISRVESRSRRRRTSRSRMTIAVENAATRQISSFTRGATGGSWSRSR